MVAINDATLWREPTFELGQRWADTMLSRSSSAPLNLRIRTTFVPSVMGRTKTILFERLCQTKELDISGIREPFSELLGTALSAPAPLLTTFCISENAGMGVPLPNTIFAGHAPCLTKLTMTFLAPPPPLLVFSNLALLSLSQPFPRLTYTQLHDLLEIMPGLHKLCLYHAIKHDSKSHIPSTPIHLPKLAVLVIVENAASICHTTMLQISSPSLTHIHSTVSSLHTDEWDVYGTLIESLIPSVTQQGLQTLWIVVEDGYITTLTIAGSKIVNISDSYGPRCKGTLERPEMHQLKHLANSTSHSCLLHAVFRLTSDHLAGIVSVYLTAGSPYYKLVPLLKMMPRLRHICISKGFLPGHGVIWLILLSDTLAELEPRPFTSQDHGNLLLPNLTTLTLHNFDNPLDIPNLDDIMLEPLKLRKQIYPGHALQKLSLCNCTVDPGLLEELQTIVPTVLCPVSDPARAGPSGRDLELGAVIA